MHNSENIELILGDIVELDPEIIPSKISVCLLDVDLKIPIYEGLKKIYPRMNIGGIILIDDCKLQSNWKGAKLGYEQFLSEINKEPQYELGIGILIKD